MHRMIERKQLGVTGWIVFSVIGSFVLPHVSSTRRLSNIFNQEFEGCFQNLVDADTQPPFDVLDSEEMLVFVNGMRTRIYPESNFLISLDPLVFDFTKDVDITGLKPNQTLSGGKRQAMEDLCTSTTNSLSLMGFDAFTTDSMFDRVQQLNITTNSSDVNVGTNTRQNNSSDYSITSNITQNVTVAPFNNTNMTFPSGNETMVPTSETSESNNTNVTRAPTAPPTSAPIAPPTSAPTAPPTSAPTAPPTSAPTIKPAPKIPVTINSSFVISNNIGLSQTELDQAPGDDLKKLNQSYAQFASRVVASFNEENFPKTIKTGNSQTTRYLRGCDNWRILAQATLDAPVDYGRDSANIIAFRNLPKCPETTAITISTLCLTVFAQYEVEVIDSEDPVAVYDLFVNETQNYISAGWLQEALNSVDPGSIFKIEGPSTPVTLMSDSGASASVPGSGGGNGGLDSIMRSLIIAICVTGVVVLVLICVYCRLKKTPLTSRNKELLSENENDRDLHDEENPPAESSPLLQELRSTPEESPMSEEDQQKEYRRQIEFLVERNCPEEKDNVNKLLEQFKGRESALIATLENIAEVEKKLTRNAENSEEELSVHNEAAQQRAAPEMNDTSSKLFSISRDLDEKQSSGTGQNFEDENEEAMAAQSETENETRDEGNGPAEPSESEVDPSQVFATEQTAKDNDDYSESQEKEEDHVVEVAPPTKEDALGSNLEEADKEEAEPEFLKENTPVLEEGRAIPTAAPMGTNDEESPESAEQEGNRTGSNNQLAEETPQDSSPNEQDAEQPDEDESKVAAVVTSTESRTEKESIEHSESEQEDHSPSLAKDDDEKDNAGNLSPEYKKSGFIPIVAPVQDTEKKNQKENVSQAQDEQEGMEEHSDNGTTDHETGEEKEEGAYKADEEEETEEDLKIAPIVLPAGEKDKSENYDRNEDRTTEPAQPAEESNKEQKGAASETDTHTVFEKEQKGGGKAEDSEVDDEERVTEHETEEQEAGGADDDNDDTFKVVPIVMPVDDQSQKKETESAEGTNDNEDQRGTEPHEEQGVYREEQQEPDSDANVGAAVVTAEVSGREDTSEGIKDQEQQDGTLELGEENGEQGQEGISSESAKVESHVGRTSILPGDQSETNEDEINKPKIISAMASAEDESDKGRDESQSEDKVDEAATPEDREEKEQDREKELEGTADDSTNSYNTPVVLPVVNKKGVTEHIEGEGEQEPQFASTAKEKEKEDEGEENINQESGDSDDGTSKSRSTPIVVPVDHEQQSNEEREDEQDVRPSKSDGEEVGENGEYSPEDTAEEVSDSKTVPVVLPKETEKHSSKHPEEKEKEKTSDTVQANDERTEADELEKERKDQTKNTGDKSSSFVAATVARSQEDDQIENETSSRSLEKDGNQSESASEPVTENEKEQDDKEKHAAQGQEEEKRSDNHETTVAPVAKTSKDKVEQESSEPADDQAVRNSKQLGEQAREDPPTDETGRTGVVPVMIPVDDKGENEDGHHSDRISEKQEMQNTRSQQDEGRDRERREMTSSKEGMANDSDAVDQEKEAQEDGQEESTNRDQSEADNSRKPFVAAASSTNKKNKEVSLGDRNDDAEDRRDDVGHEVHLDENEKEGPGGIEEPATDKDMAEGSWDDGNDDVDWDDGDVGNEDDVDWEDAVEIPVADEEPSANEEWDEHGNSAVDEWEDGFSGNSEEERRGAPDLAEDLTEDTASEEKKKEEVNWVDGGSDDDAEQWGGAEANEEAPGGNQTDVKEDPIGPEPVAESLSAELAEGEDEDNDDAEFENEESENKETEEGAAVPTKKSKKKRKKKKKGKNHY